MTTEVEQVLTILDQVVAEFGHDYVYQPPGPGDFACLYVHGKLWYRKPGCLVGQVLHRMGVPLRELAKNDKNNVAVTSNSFSVPIVLHDDTKKVLAEAQRTQDNDQTWGQARDDAYAKANRLGYSV